MAAIASCAVACQPASTELTEGQRAAIRNTVEQRMAEMANALTQEVLSLHKKA